MSYLATLTPEQLSEVREKSLKARAEKKAKHEAEAHLLKQNFADEAHWRALATKYQVRLPNSIVPGSELKLIRKAASKMGLSPAEIREAVGDIETLHELNPTWPAFALIGLLLEVADDRGI